MTPVKHNKNIADYAFDAFVAFNTNSMMAVHGNESLVLLQLWTQGLTSSENKRYGYGVRKWFVL